LPTCMLQRCERHCTSVWHGKATAEGCEVGAPVVGAGLAGAAG